MSEESSKKTKIICGVVLGIIVIVVAILFFLKGCAKEFTVSFDSNGGSIVNSIDVKENDTITKPSDPTKEGSIFAGWYYYDKLFDFNTKITEDITLVAKWLDEEKIVLDSATLSLEVGEAGEVKIVSYPSDLTLQDLLFVSSDEEVVKVSEDGKLTALKEGTAVVTVKSKDGKYEEKVTITVSNKEVEETPTETDKKPSTTTKPSGTTNPSGTTKPNTGSTGGTTKPSGGSSSGSQGGSTPPSEETPTPPIEVEVTGVTITGKDTVNVGEKLKLEVNITPSDATDKSVKWEIVSGSDNATIDQSGNVTAKKAGKITVKVTTSNGKSATKEITIKSVYKVVMTPECIEIPGMVPQRYIFKVYKDGTSTTDYIKFMYNGIEATPKSYSIATLEIKTTITTVTIETNTGNFDASVQYEIPKNC